MKLLLDENLSRRLVPFLLDAFPDSTQVALLGMERATDRVIWEYARDHGYTIVTRDTDFQEMATQLGKPPPVVMICTGNCSKITILSLLLEHRDHIIEGLSQPEVVCVELG